MTFSHIFQVTFDRNFSTRTRSVTHLWWLLLICAGDCIAWLPARIIGMTSRPYRTTQWPYNKVIASSWKGTWTHTTSTFGDCCCYWWWLYWLPARIVGIYISNTSDQQDHTGLLSGCANPLLPGCSFLGREGGCTSMLHPITRKALMLCTGPSSRNHSVWKKHLCYHGWQNCTWYVSPFLPTATLASLLFLRQHGQSLFLTVEP